MARNLTELCAPYPQIDVATSDDNDEILDFLSRVAMKTERGSIKFSRSPDFFALTKVQSALPVVFLYRNTDGSLSGVSAFSASRYNIRGREEYCAYASDLRFSPGMSKTTRLQFTKWYSDLTEHCHQMEEFFGAKTILTSVFDENEAAKKALVDRKGKRVKDIIYRPVFPYQNINVFGRIPFMGRRSLGPIKKVENDSLPRLLQFLTTNTENSQIVWSESELRRKHSILKFNWSDFIVIEDLGGKILAACLPFSDSELRRAVLSDLSFPVRALGQSLPLFGKPSFTNGTQLNTGYLSFLKIASQDPGVRAGLVAQLIHHVLDQNAKLLRSERFHTLTFMDAQKFQMEKLLKKKGLLSSTLPATLYQVIHRKHLRKENLLLRNPKARPDFEVSFA